MFEEPTSHVSNPKVVDPSPAPNVVPKTVNKNKLFYWCWNHQVFQPVGACISCEPNYRTNWCVWTTKCRGCYNTNKGAFLPDTSRSSWTTSDPVILYGITIPPYNLIIAIIEKAVGLIKVPSPLPPSPPLNACVCETSLASAVVLVPWLCGALPDPIAVGWACGTFVLPTLAGWVWGTCLFPKLRVWLWPPAGLRTPGRGSALVFQCPE